MQIFISHHTESDGVFANRLAADLNLLGVDVWIAPASIRPGEEWIQAITRGLEESTHFALVSTPRAYSSDWVRKEYNIALMLEAENQITIIPLEVEAAKIPLFLRVFQVVQFSDNYESGLHRLADFLGVSSHLERIDFERAEGVHREHIQYSPDNPVKPREISTEPRVFLAYVKADQEYVNHLSTFLENNGLNLWRAAEDIQIGTRWDFALVDAIIDSTAMIVVMSPEAQRSEWVQAELSIASRERIPIFPILLAGQPFDDLRKIQFFDARDGKMPLQRFVDRLKTY